MLLEQLASLSQVIGVVGVIASLIYVGKQLRQNTEQMQIDAATNYSLWVDQIFARTSTDREFAVVWQKGGSDFNSLDDVDKGRVMNHEIGALFMQAHFYALLQSNALPKHIWDRQLWTLKHVSRRQSVREAWKVYREAFEKPFQEFCEPFLK